MASTVAAPTHEGQKETVAPLQQNPLSGLCILGCRVDVCLRRSAFKAKQKADFPFEDEASALSKRTHAHIQSHTHRSENTGTYLGETRVALALTSTVLLLPVLSYASCRPVAGESLTCQSKGSFQFVHQI